MTLEPVDVAVKDRMSVGHHAFIAARLVAGYILAVAVGSVVFAVTARYLTPDMTWPNDPEVVQGPLWLIGQTAILYFAVGIMFGIPYTVLGTLGFWFLTRRNTTWLLLIGTLCPAAAVLLMFSMLNAITFDWKMFKLLLATLPAGLAATYVYGAIGMGYGFGRWRLG